MGKFRVTLPRSALLSALAELLAAGNSSFAWGLAGTVHRSDSIEFVIANLKTIRLDLDLRRETPGAVLFLLRADSRPASVSTEWAADLLTSAGMVDDRSIGLLAISSDGSASGWLRSDGRWSPITEFHWPGPGMPCVHHIPKPTLAKEPADYDDRDSRLSGALGSEILERLRTLRYAVIGVSRVGSLIAHSLARMGARDICLVDPDVVEPHNADAGEFHPFLDEGQNKAAATARQIRRVLVPGGRVEDYGLPLAATLAFSAAREADVIITAVDDDGARLIASLLATSCLRVHLDIGTQVLRNAAGLVNAGADIRLIVPDSPPRCLACFGGFAQPDDLHRLAKFDSSETPHWQRRRSGSLRSVNQIAAHLGLRLLEKLVSGDISQSNWIRYEETPSPNLREVVPRLPLNCPLCGSTSGIGDDIFLNRELRLRRLVRTLVGTETSVRPNS